MSTEIKTLCEQDLDAVFELAKFQFLKQSKGLDPLRAEMATWSAPWRKEALEFYLPKGWSFGFLEREVDQLNGFFLGQVLVHYRGLTQTLWVEQMISVDPDLWPEMVDVAIKLAKSKHLQAVIFHNTSAYLEHLKIYKIKKIEEDIYIVSTCKKPVEELL